MDKLYYIVGYAGDSQFILAVYLDEVLAREHFDRIDMVYTNEVMLYSVPIFKQVPLSPKKLEGGLAYHNLNILDRKWRDK